MNKTAEVPSELLGYGGVGAGVFALGALLQEVKRQRELEAQRSRQQLPSNALVLDLPKKASDAFMKTAEGFIDHALSALIGAPAGYMGAKLLYDKHKEQQGNKEIQEANMRYLQVLQQLQQKSAEMNTPHVDAFCKTAAEALVKAATNPLLSRLLMGAVGVGAGAGYANDFGLFDSFKGGKSGPPAHSPGGVVNKAKDAWKLLAALAAVGTSGAMIHASNKRESREKPKLPSAVAVNYQDVPAGPLPAPIA